MPSFIYMTTIVNGEKNYYVKNHGFEILKHIARYTIIVEMFIIYILTYNRLPITLKQYMRNPLNWSEPTWMSCFAYSAVMSHITFVTLLFVM